MVFAVASYGAQPASSLYATPTAMTRPATAHTGYVNTQAHQVASQFGSRVRAGAAAPVAAWPVGSGPETVSAEVRGSTPVGTSSPWVLPAAVTAVCAALVSFLWKKEKQWTPLPALGPVDTVGTTFGHGPLKTSPQWAMCHHTAEPEYKVGEVAVKFDVQSTAAADYEGSTLVHIVTKEEAEGLQLPASQKEEFEGKDGQTTVAYDLPGYKASRVILIGCGEAEKVTARTLRCAATTAVSQLKARKMASAAVAFPDAAVEDLNAAGIVGSLMLQTDYFYDQLISDADRCFHLEAVTLLTSTEMPVVEEYIALAKATCLTRDLLNTRADIATVNWMADQAEAMCAKYDSIEMKVVDFAEIQEKGMHLIEAVGKGAVEKPKIVFMHYKGDPDSKKSLALVGKGICFDTGGLNLKPTGSIEQMHMDKGGACAVFGTIEAIAAAGLKTNVVGVLVLAENAIDQSSCKPFEIMRSYKGLTVQNNNTDAEGRLVLADAMTYCQKEYEVDQLFTIATLTGAIILSLGHYAAGMFTHSDETAAKLTEAGKPADERVWRMPLFQEYTDQLKGTHCDIHSMGTGRAAGSCTAAAFLGKFIEEGVEFTHLDIAGCAGDLMGADDRPWIPKGATGWGPNILYHYIKKNRTAA